MPSKFPRIAAFMVAALIAAPALADGGQMLRLPDGRVAVVTQGALEAASIGSYSVVIFKNAQLTDFVAGIVRPRDGSLFDDQGRARVSFTELAGDGRPAMILTFVSAGSGGYLSVDALRVGREGIALLAHVDGLAPDADVAAALQAAYRKKAVPVPRAAAVQRSAE